MQAHGRLQEYYKSGLGRLRYAWDELEESGDEYQDRTHAYAVDLDLFGRGSIFQLLCVARTGIGRQTLADWLKTPASREDVLARHSAVSELRARPELSEALALAGVLRVGDCHWETFQNWLKAPPVPIPLWPASGAILLAFCTVLLPFLAWAGVLAKTILIPLLSTFLVMEFVLALSLFKRVRMIIAPLRLLSIELPIVVDILQILERNSFSSPRLADLKNTPGEMPRLASAELSRLNRLIGLLDQRNNEMFTIPSWVMLWGTQFAMAIERWRRQHGDDFERWLKLTGEFEALVSLSVYSFEHPLDPFPELTEETVCLEAEGIAHPLLDERICVRNDFGLDEGRFVIVSGSNMSGKSTFLRAIGLNVVLAWAGAPVRCRRLRVGTFKVGAIIRVQDSLVDGRSHFFAEVERLRNMISAADGPIRTLFLIDEILSGTNSRDRRAAAELILNALTELGALGLITTHDLTLTEIATSAPARGANIHFTDSADGESLHFDYRLREGVLQQSNAMAILELLGIRR
jgi:hypothetical protein